MTHQSDTTALRSRAEEGNLGLVAPELLGVGQHGLPGGVVAGILVVLDRRQMGAESGICLDDAPPADLEEGNERRTKVPVRRPLSAAAFLSSTCDAEDCGLAPHSHVHASSRASARSHLFYPSRETNGRGKKMRGGKEKEKKGIEMKRRKKIN
jgi:hypothetical protein